MVCGVNPADSPSGISDCPELDMPLTLDLAILSCLPLGSFSVTSVGVSFPKMAV